MLRPEALTGATLADRYQIKSKIGQGGMAHVYLAFDTKLERKIALKVLDKSRTSQAKAIARFMREARTAAKLNHPNVVTIYEVGEVDDVYYIAMEYLEGKTLKDIMMAMREQGRLLPLSESIRIINQIGDALTYAYETEKIVHRDVKPSNIMIDDKNTIKLTDFGIAKALEIESELTTEGTAIGTPMYMSPEHAEGLKIDHRSDVYSLGIIVYQLLTGYGPFGQTTTPGQLMYKHVHELPEPPRKRNKSVPRAVEKVTLKALEKKPAKRFETAREFAQALTVAERKKMLPPLVTRLLITLTLTGLIAGGGYYALLQSGTDFYTFVNQFQGNIANVMASYNAAPPSLPPTPVPTQIQSAPEQVLQSVTIGDAHLRVGPGDVYKEIGLLGAEATVIVKAKNTDGSWVKVNVGDIVGWLNAGLLDLLVTDVAELPVAVVPPTPTSTPNSLAQLPENTPTPIVVTSTPKPTPTPIPTRTPTNTPTPRPTNTRRPPTATPTITNTPTPVPITGRIAFPMDDGGGHYDVWIVYLPDGVPYRAIQGARQPNFSKKDGRLLVNGEDNPGGNNNILLADREAKGITMVSDSPSDVHPFWDPDGTRYVFDNGNLLTRQSGNQFLFVPCSLKRPKDEAESNCSDLVNEGFLTGPGDVLGEYPIWTADGRHTIIFRGAGGSTPYGMYYIPSWATERDGGGQVAGLLVNAPNGRPADAYGDRIFFFTNDWDDNWEVYSINVNGSNLTNLSNNPGSSDGHPAVSPDGHWVAFTSDRDGYWGVWIVPVTGGTPHKLFDFPKQFPWGSGVHDWTTERISWGP